MGPLHSSVVSVESAHDDLPTTAGILELFAFTWQLLPDIFASENVLGVHKSKTYRGVGTCTGGYASDLHQGNLHVFKLSVPPNKSTDVAQ